MAALLPCTARKARRFSANIRFFTSASNQSKWHIWTAADARPSGCRDHETAYEAFQTARPGSVDAPEGDVRRRLLHLSLIAAAVVFAGGCAASQAFRNGNAAMK